MVAATTRYHPHDDRASVPDERTGSPFARAIPATVGSAEIRSRAGEVSAVARRQGAVDPRRSGRSSSTGVDERPAVEGVIRRRPGTGRDLGARAPDAASRRERRRVPRGAIPRGRRAEPPHHAAERPGSEASETACGGRRASPATSTTLESVR
jgi:hypothetical protein